MHFALTRRCSLAVALLAVLSPALVVALVQPPENAPLFDRAFSLDDLEVPIELAVVDDLALGLRDRARSDLETLGVAVDRARFDLRTGGWGTLIPSLPIIPGDGVGNRLDWAELDAGAPRDQAELRRLVDARFRRFIDRFAGALRLDPSELSRPRISIHDDGELIQIYAGRQVGGVPVRDSYLTATIGHGNLILFGTRNWAPIDRGLLPRTSRPDAERSLGGYLRDVEPTGYRSDARLELVPAATRSGVTYRLAWVLAPEFDGLGGRWEALIDADSGDALAFRDLNQYAHTRAATGGVFPVSNDGLVPDGVEQAWWPMPYTDISSGAGTVFTDAGGNVPPGVTGTMTTTLDGLFVTINDDCGSISESSDGNINMGTSGGTDCATPPGASNGNTHSSRSGFYELNRMIEVAQSHLPSNNWLQDTLTANMNGSGFFLCNAFWSGSVNFYRSAAGCSNTGELAGVFDHEWGHGMDDNDANPNISSPGEGIADIYAALRLNDSCIGRNFLVGTPCSGYGDPCIECDGVRDIDWANRQSGEPHDLDWINANCGGTSHCEGAVYAEAVWDLYTRDLAAAPFDLNSDTAREIVMRLTFLGAGMVGSWYGASDGCNADGGYLNYLAVDDDNGNINDGTPHMTAIFDAYDRHGIACATPTPQNAGCSGTPDVAPVVTGTPLDQGVELTWTPVTGASAYRVYRTDGVFACDFGKTVATETTGTSFNDSNLLNGRNYSYNVAAIGPADSCIGPTSACTTVRPNETLTIDLSLSGSCPGPVDVTLTGATPNAPLGIVVGSGFGSSSVPGGACEGVALDVTSPSPITVIEADSSGGLSVSPNVPSANCGDVIQVLDTASCQTSDAVAIP